jgi:hypothetical protein
MDLYNVIIHQHSQFTFSLKFPKFVFEIEKCFTSKWKKTKIIEIYLFEVRGIDVPVSLQCFRCFLYFL